MGLGRTLSIRSTRSKYSPPRDISPLQGRVYVITGGNNGIGKATVLALAQHGPARIFVCARNLKKGRAAIAEVRKQVPNANVELIELDLACFASVARAAREIRSKTRRIDVLINNAGVMAVPPNKTVDGYEMQWATNYMGHALFTRQLLPTMLKTAATADADVRIINVSSYGHHTAPSEGINFSDPNLSKSNIWTRYGQSKLAIVLHARELAKRYPQLLCVALHPGAIETNLADTFVGEVGSKILHPIVGPFLKTATEGAFNQLWLATSPREGIESGGYYLPVGKLDKGSKLSQDEELADKLWKWTESEFKSKGVDSMSQERKDSGMAVEDMEVSNVVCPWEGQTSPLVAPI